MSPQQRDQNPVEITYRLEDPQAMGAADREVRATGRPGDSLLQVALGAGVEIEHACGGVGACGTCHVHVEQGMDALSEPDETEEDSLDQAAGVRPNSRLSCQCRIVGGAPVVVTVPAWNRNAARETR